MARAAPILLAALAALFVALLGGSMTEIGPWYRGLAKPSWQPPDWLFGPAWTVIFALTAAAGVIGWRRARQARQRHAMLALFALNALLNVAWSWLFFRLQRPDWACFEVVLLWLSIIVLIWHLRGYAPKAALLLLPYLAWVSFAAVLNWTVAALNGYL